METSESKNELMQEIENMYIISVLDGKYTGKGSFVAISGGGREFFANKELVEKKSELIKMLSERIRPLWILVKDQIWGGKWNNKSVSEIKAISENKKDCEKYKAKLTQQLQLKMEIIDLHVQHLKLIEDSYRKPSFYEEQKLLREISVLEEKLSELNSKVDY